MRAIFTESLGHETLFNTVVYGSNETNIIMHTVLSLINAPGALQFFKRGMFMRQVFNAKMQCLSLFTMTRNREI